MSNIKLLLRDKKVKKYLPSGRRKGENMIYVVGLVAFLAGAFVGWGLHRWALKAAVNKMILEVEQGDI